MTKLFFQIIGFCLAIPPAIGVGYSLIGVHELAISLVFLIGFCLIFTSGVLKFSSRHQRDIVRLLTYCSVLMVFGVISSSIFSQNLNIPLVLRLIVYLFALVALTYLLTTNIKFCNYILTGHILGSLVFIIQLALWFNDNQKFFFNVPILHFKESVGDTVSIGRNDISYFLGNLIFISLIKMYWGTKKLSLYGWLALTAFILNLFTFSRSSLLMLPLSFLFAAILIKGQSKYRLISLYGVICIFLSASFIYFYKTADFIYLEYLANAFKEGSGLIRVYYVLDGLRIFVNNPFGIGLGSYEMHEGNDFGTHDPHNLFLWLAVELGVFGIIGLLGIYVVTYRVIANVYSLSRKALKFSLMAFFLFFVAKGFVSGYAYSLGHLPVILPLLIAISIRSEGKNYEKT